MAFKCYVCLGAKDDYSKNKLANHKDASLKMCEDGLDTCMKTATEVDGATGVISKCSTKTVCETAKQACETSDDCEVGCCDGRVLCVWSGTTGVIKINVTVNV